MDSRLGSIINQPCDNGHITSFSETQLSFCKMKVPSIATPSVRVGNR